MIVDTIDYGKGFSCMNGIDSAARNALKPTGQAVKGLVASRDTVAILCAGRAAKPADHPARRGPI